MTKDKEIMMARNRSIWRNRFALIMTLCVTSVSSGLYTPLLHAQEKNSGEASRTKGSLNFVNADIGSVIAAVGEYTHTNFIIDPRVKGTLSLVSEKSLSKSQALELLASVLRLRGYSIVPGPSYSKVVPAADAKLQAPPLQTGSIRGDQIATQIFRLNYESATNLVSVLRPLISPNNTINANLGSNTLIITDYADNLKRLGKIISALDGPENSEPDFVPVIHGVASDIAASASRLLEYSTRPGSSSGKVSLLTDPRTNSIIIQASTALRTEQAKSLIANLDQPTKNPGNVHVVYLRNAEATKLAKTLSAVMSFDPSAMSTSPSNPSSRSTTLKAPNADRPSSGGAGFIQADPTTNTLIITASEPVYRNIRAVIDLLDARRAQVYIESLIVEVTAKRAAEFGVQWGSVSGNSNSDYRIGGLTSFNSGGDNIAALASGGGDVLPGAGLSLGIFRQINGEVGLGALARALASDDSANILSMPNLLTLDNEEAEIIVGQNVPFITGQYATSASGGSAGVNPFQTIERKDIGLSLRVRPQVSEGGTVRMAIYQETSSVLDSLSEGGLITNKRSIDTNVLVDDGQIIVLGGLIDDTMQDSTVKVPGLGDLPLIGNLFKYQKRSRVKTNLMVFIRPTVIRSNVQSVSLASDRYNFIRNAKIAAEPESKFTLPDMGSPILPELKGGQIDQGLLFDRMDQVPLFDNPSLADNPTQIDTPSPVADSPQAAASSNDDGSVSQLAE